MGNRKHHKQRIKELEGLFGGIEDQDETIEINAADPKRFALAAQMEENTFWANLPDDQIPDQFSETHEALKDVRERASGPAGYLPGQKPLLYRLDYHEMARRNALETVDMKLIDSLQWWAKEYLRMEGRIMECADWLRVQDEHGDWGTLVVGKEGREAKMPTFGTAAEVDVAMRQRAMAMAGLSEEEVKEGRLDRYHEDAMQHAQALDAENKADAKNED